MKNIIRIARIELNTLFCSPIAWFLFVVFSVISSLRFVAKLTEYTTWQEMGRDRVKFMYPLTYKIFSAPGYMSGHFFPYVVENVYWFLPLMTMGLISREMGNGTIKLLYSSPLKVSEIVWGKFLAVMMMNFVFIMILGVYISYAVTVISAPDYGYLAGAMLGFYLVVCTYGAIGLFVSCLTGYQLVAAIGTFGILFMLDYIGNMWQYVDVVRDLTDFIWISNKAVNFFDGLIYSGDLAYYILIIGMFLLFAQIHLHALRKPVSFSRRMLRYAGVLATVLITGYILCLPPLRFYADLSATKRNTIAKGTQALIAAFGDEPVEVNSYINIIEPSTNWLGKMDARKADERRWSKYSRFKPDIKFTYTYFYDSVPNPAFYRQFPDMTLEDIARRAAESDKLDFEKVRSPEEIRKMVSMPSELARYCIQVKFKNRTTFLRIYDTDMERYPSETEVAVAFKKLLVHEMPRYAFVQGAFERSPFKSGERHLDFMNTVWIRYAPINQGYEMDTVDLRVRDVPKGLSALVLADPRVVLDTATHARLQRYIDSGGNLIILTEHDMAGVMNPFLQQFGISMMPGLLVERSRGGNAQGIAECYLTEAAVGLQSNLGGRQKDSVPVMMPGAVPLAYVKSEYDIQPLAVTDPRYTWLSPVVPVLDSAEVTFHSDRGDKRGLLPTVVKLTRTVGGRQQRIVVAGDTDWLSNKVIGIGANFYVDNLNGGLLTAIFSWMTNGDFPVDLSRPADKDRHIDLQRDSVPAIQIVFTFILPGIMLLAAAIFLIRRRRR